MIKHMKTILLATCLAIFSTGCASKSIAVNLTQCEKISGVGDHIQKCLKVSDDAIDQVAK